MILNAIKRVSQRKKILGIKGFLNTVIIIYIYISHYLGKQKPNQHTCRNGIDIIYFDLRPSNQQKVTTTIEYLVHTGSMIN